MAPLSIPLFIDDIAFLFQLPPCISTIQGHDLADTQRAAMPMREATAHIIAKFPWYFFILWLRAKAGVSAWPRCWAFGESLRSSHFSPALLIIHTPYREYLLAKMPRAAADFQLLESRYLSCHFIKLIGHGSIYWAEFTAAVTHHSPIFAGFLAQISQLDFDWFKWKGGIYKLENLYRFPLCSASISPYHHAQGYYYSPCS